MKRKLLLISMAAFVFSGHTLAQEPKTSLSAKSVEKLQSTSIEKATSTEKGAKLKPFNPDKPDFLGVPAVVTDPKRP